MMWKLIYQCIFHCVKQKEQTATVAQGQLWLACKRNISVFDMHYIHGHLRKSYWYIQSIKRHNEVWGAEALRSKSLKIVMGVVTKTVNFNASNGLNPHLFCLKIILTVKLCDIVIARETRELEHTPAVMMCWPRESFISQLPTFRHRSSSG